jgi:Xaa-Pro aminopeptidase
VTLLAIRDVRQHVQMGMRESQVQSLMLSALSAAGLTSPTASVLFGCAFPILTHFPKSRTQTVSRFLVANAATPHGTSTDRELGEEDLITVDCGGRLHGYWSDIARVRSHPFAF